MVARILPRQGTAKHAVDLSEIGDALGRVHRMLQARLPTEGPSGSVTREQWTLLTGVARAGEGGASMGQLADIRGMPLNAVSTLVDRLVNSGVLERRADEKDRRVVRVVFSQRGQMLYREVARARRAVMTGVLARLSDEQLASLHAALPALLALVEAGL